MAKRDQEKEKDKEKEPDKKVVKAVSTKERKAKQDLAAAFFAETPDEIKPKTEEEVSDLESGAPKKGLEGSDVNLTSFELMTVSGADAEQINTYLDTESKKLFKQDLKDISDEQYDKLLSDKVKFHKWMAINWVDNYISKRKDEVRAIADEKTSEYGSDDYSRVSKRNTPIKEYQAWSKTMNLPESSEVDKMRKEIYGGRERVMSRSKKMRQGLAELEASLMQQHADMVEQQRNLFAGQGFEAGVLEGMLGGLEATYAKARADLVSEQERAIQVFEETGISEFESRVTEIEDEYKKVVSKLRLGTKREMVLTADRWGRVLKKLTNINPEAVSVSENGVVSLDYFETTREGQKVIKDHIGRELDRIIEAKSDGSKSALRQHNLEALFKSEEEIGVAKIYTRLLWGEFHSGVKPNPKDVKRHHLLFSHLRKEGFVEPVEALEAEAELGGLYREQKLPFPTALKEVKTMIESEKNPNVEAVVRGLVGLVKSRDAFAWSTSGRRSSISEYGTMFSEVIESIEEKNKTENHTENVPWFELQEALHEKKDGYLDRRVLPAIYRIKTQRNERLSVVSRYYILPNTLKDDFLGSQWRPAADSLTTATADQMRVHFKKWMRDGERGRAKVREEILAITESVQKTVKGNFDTVNHVDYVGTDPRGLVKKMEEEMAGMKLRLGQQQKRLELLAELAKEI